MEKWSVIFLFSEIVERWDNLMTYGLSIILEYFPEILGHSIVLPQLLEFVAGRMHTFFRNSSIAKFKKHIYHIFPRVIFLVEKRSGFRSIIMKLFTPKSL